MGAAQFRYVLEPIALQRRWALDALMRDLGECNHALAQRRAEHDAVLARIALAGDEWKALGNGGEAVRVERFALLSRYLGECQRQAQGIEQALVLLRRQRDVVIEQVGVAQRAVDAVDEHRGEMYKAFTNRRLSGEFKDADDQWNVLQTMRATNGD